MCTYTYMNKHTWDRICCIIHTRIHTEIRGYIQKYAHTQAASSKQLQLNTKKQKAVFWIPTTRIRIDGSIVR
jgi:hypothetical protein